MPDPHLSELQEQIESFLNTCLPDVPEYLAGSNAMLSYSLESGGKRVRPLLALLFCEAAGGKAERALPFACAVEFIHTYSLIHDDLPCMDNDDFRRGKPSSHKRFGEANALLAGDALLTHAFFLACRAGETGVSPEATVKAVSLLSALAGLGGMIGGQIIDLESENRRVDAETLFRMDALKTGALIRAACVLGCLAADADGDKTEAADRFALHLGLAFQIVDDILEYESEDEHSDEVNGKATYITELGPEEAKALAASHTEQAIEALSVFGERGERIAVFASALLRRQS